MKKYDIGMKICAILFVIAFMAAVVFSNVNICLNWIIIAANATIIVAWIIIGKKALDKAEELDKMEQESEEDEEA